MASGTSAPDTAEIIAEASRIALGTLPEDPMRESILALKREQARLRQEKLQLAKTIRNAKKRQQRLRSKAREMSDEDLVAVLMMRKDSAGAKARRLENTGAAKDPAGSASRASSSNEGAPAAASSASSVARLEDGNAATEAENAREEQGRVDTDEG